MRSFVLTPSFLFFESVRLFPYVYVTRPFYIIAAIMPCSQFLTAWAVGGGRFCLPQEVGFLIERNK